jgi:hypothetical protein
VFELGGLMLSRLALYHLNHSANPFLCVWSVFKRGSQELFAHMGLKS